MRKKVKEHAVAFRFRRFCRAKWAAYNSMHREVTIGRVATYIADRQVRKAAAVVATGLLIATEPLAAQTEPSDGDGVLLQEVVVAAAADTLFGSSEPAAVITADDLRNSSVRTVGDILQMLPGVDVRTRGVGDVQGDLSMRGGSFDQMVVLLGGINITDAQTGHHNLDLPVDVSMVQRVELLSPAQMMARGIVAFCGAVNIVVADEYRDRLLAEASYGSYGTLNVSALGSKVMGQWVVAAAAAMHRSDGYVANTDYSHGSLMLQATRHGTSDDWHLQLGGQIKDFGSQAFYSVSYPDQFEATRTLIGSVFNIHRFSDKTRMETALYGRLHSDRFELFRTGYVDAPAWYGGHNYHIGTTEGVRSRLVTGVGQGEMLVGVEMRRDGIWSNVLGLPDASVPEPYTMSSDRLNATLFAGYSLQRATWKVEADVLGLYNNRFGLNYGLAANAEKRIGKARLYASMSRTYRLPSFTDLYYKSATQIANPDLNAESSMTGEVGASITARSATLAASLFYRDGSQIIDWVRSESEDLWYSMNHTSVDAMGVDLNGRYRWQWLTLTAGYSFCNMVLESGAMVSKYALEYLRHKVQVGAVVEMGSHWRLTPSVQYRAREGYYADADGEGVPYGDVLLCDVGIEYWIGHYRMFARGYNLTDADYREHGGVPMPGRTMLIGVRVEY